MAKRGRNTDGPDGLLLVDKPAGISSAAVVARVRRVFGGVKAGHTGTLDPFATGLLPLGLGEGTKLATFLTDADKTYEGVIRLGISTDTLDRTGTVVATSPVPDVSESALAALSQEFLRQTEQTPPAYSAIKKDGRPMYELARRGEAPELEPRPVRVDRCELRHAAPDRIHVAIDCSKGFYVRSLARDVGERVGCGAVLDSLRRTRVGHLRLEDAVPLASLEVEGGREAGAAALRSLSDAVSHLRGIAIDRQEADELRLGRQGPLLRVPRGERGEKVRIFVRSAGQTPGDDELVAVASSDGALWLLDRVFARPVRPCPHDMIVLPPPVSQTEEEEKERSESS